ncbi:hypothetical protein, partial [Escherichia coli]|uniref:hypothetical protein n=1 Tax=Escherichia coli TaxID=562 RepID=UPI0028DD6F28|nr:hypothetical protein [Escherichia coli]
IPCAVRELIRFDPPVQIVARVAKSDQPLGGLLIRAGERVCVALALLWQNSAIDWRNWIPESGFQ